MLSQIIGQSQSRKRVTPRKERISKKERVWVPPGDSPLTSDNYWPPRLSGPVAPDRLAAAPAARSRMPSDDPAIGPSEILTRPLRQAFDTEVRKWRECFDKRLEDEPAEIAVLADTL